MNWRFESVLFPVLGALALATNLPAQCGHGVPSPGSLGSEGPAAAAGPATPSGPASPSAPSPSGPESPQPAAPHGPTTSGPSSPSAPTGPTTGRGMPGGGSPLKGPATGPRGVMMLFERGATSKDRLKIDWEHPVPPAASTNHTSVGGPLPLADALKILWDGDERPLLVLRECSFCQDTDQALLTRSMNNDRTQLLTKWFRVVRLPPHVTEPTHPFHNVFAGYSFKTMPHFYLLADPSAKPVEFSGVQTQSMLWKGMYSVLEQRYRGSPTKAVKEWLSLLDELDRSDSLMLATQQQLDAARAEAGPDSDRAEKLQKRLADVKKDHADALAREARVRDLGLVAMGK